MTGRFPHKEPREYRGRIKTIIKDAIHKENPYPDPNNTYFAVFTNKDGDLIVNVYLRHPETNYVIEEYYYRVSIDKMTSEEGEK